MVPNIENLPKALGENIKDVEMQSAKEILGDKFFFGPDEIETVFSKELSATEIPAIPFSRKDLEHAREKGASLILRVDTAPDGQPLTMAKVSNILGDKHKIDPSVGRSVKPGESETGKGEVFYNTETPRAGWALVSGKKSRTYDRENYLHQTMDLAADCRNAFEQDIPKEYRQAIEELNQYLQKKWAYPGADKIRTENKDDRGGSFYEDFLKKIDSGNYPEELTSLKINQLLRRSPVEVVYDHILARESKSRDMTLPAHNMGSFELTCSSDSDGMIIDVGILGYPPKIAISHIKPSGVNPISNYYRICRRS